MPTDPLFQYNKFYEMRELLCIGKQGGFEDDHFFQPKSSKHGRQEVSVQNMARSEFKDCDVLYWVFDNCWLHPMRTFISSKWNVKEETFLAEAVTKWSYLMPKRFLEKVLQMYLKPRLKREVSDNWNAREISNQSNLIERWLLPWRDLFGDKEM